MSDFAVIILVAASLLTLAMILMFYQRFAFAFTLFIINTWHAAFSIIAVIGKTFDTLIFSVALISTIANVIGIIFSERIEREMHKQYEGQYQQYAEAKLNNKKKRRQLKIDNRNKDKT